MPHGYPIGPLTWALKGPGRYVQHRAPAVRGPFDVKIARAAPLRRHRIHVNLCKKTFQNVQRSYKYRSRGRRRTQTVHRTAPGRAPCGAPVQSDGARKLTARHPYGLLTGALRLHSTNFHRTSPGRRRICDHTTRRRNENRKVPVRSLKSYGKPPGAGKSYGARWICDLGFKHCEEV